MWETIERLRLRWKDTLTKEKKRDEKKISEEIILKNASLDLSQQLLPIYSGNQADILENKDLTLINNSSGSIYYHIIVPLDTRFKIIASPIIGKLKRGHSQNFELKLYAFCTLSRELKLTVTVSRRKNSAPFKYLEVNLKFQSQFSDKLDLSEIHLGKLIGRGGNAQVYKGEYDGQTVAVKVLKGDNFISARLLELESQSLKVAQNPNVVKYIAKATSGRNQFALVMEYVSGGSLYHHLRREELDENDKLKLAIEVAHSVSQIHSLKVYHRDLKSANFLVSRESGDIHLKLGDFGAANVGKEPTEKLRSVPGTVTHQAPEGFQDDSYDLEKADIFSMGVVLWEIYTQSEPFRNLSDTEVVAVVSKGRLLEIDENFPPEIARIVKNCMNIKPKKRPTAKQVLEELQFLEKK